MPRKLRPATQNDLNCVRCVVDDLRNMRDEAVHNRDFLKNLGSPKAALAMQNVVEAIRRALKVTEGAARHMSRRVNASEQMCEEQLTPETEVVIIAGSALDFEGAKKWWESPLLSNEVPIIRGGPYSNVEEFDIPIGRMAVIDLSDD